MKSFWNACKNRSIILWILLILWFLACSLICCMLRDEYHTPLAFLIYLLMLFPICHLFLYQKPWNVCSIIQIVSFYIALIIFLCSLIWTNIPRLVYLAASWLCIFNSLLFFELEEKWRIHQYEKLLKEEEGRAE